MPLPSPLGWAPRPSETKNGITPPPRPYYVDGVVLFMDVPIKIDDRETGRLSIRQEGPYTVFEGRSEDPGRLLRLSVYGAGQEGKLGVMMPEKGVLGIRKRLSRAELRNFPERIDYAGESGARLAPPPPPPSAEPPAPSPPPSSAAPRPAPQAPSPPAPPERPERGGDLLWYSAGDGSLYTSWEGKRYRAIPAAAHGLPESRIVEKRRIEGVEYAVFEAGGAEVP